MLKKYLTDPSILFLLAGNIYCIYYYGQHSDSFATIVWIYWIQSVLIGLLNFLDLLTIKNFKADKFTMGTRPVTSENKGCTAWFFLCHYGFFHLLYAIFLSSQIGISTVNKNALLLGVAAFFIESIINFMRQKRMEKYVAFDLGAMFFLPYLRIVPMHLMILVPAFFGIKSMVFLVLKMVADIFSFVLYHYLFAKNNSNNNPQ